MEKPERSEEISQEVSLVEISEGGLGVGRVRYELREPP